MKRYIALVILGTTAVNAAAVTALVYLAHLERGHAAFGGEWLLIMLIAAGSIWLASRLISARVDTERWKRDPLQDKYIVRRRAS